MNSKSKFWILLPILLLSSCYKSTEWEEVTSDYDPVLNVIGIISLDGNIENFVEVYPTIDLTSLSMELVGYDSTFVYYTGKGGEDNFEDCAGDCGGSVDGYWDIKEIFKPANIIDSATVRIFTETDTFLFNYDENDGKYKNSDFEPFPDSLYNLSVEVNGFDFVIGELITPSIPIIDSNLSDTLSSSSAYTINWDEQESGNYGLIMGELVDSYVWCGGEFYSPINFNSEGFTVSPEWCDPEEIEIGDNDNDYETLRIRLMAMDDNYYEYFAAERFKDFSNFLFETDGTVGQSVGIEGGFGVFGAFASDTFTRVLSP